VTLWMWLVVLGAGAYLMGSVSFAVVVSRLMKLSDPRSYGSGNPGATNVLRSGNKKAAALTLAGDALKGVIAVVACQLIAARVFPDQRDAQLLVMAVSALMVFLGHLYPIFHGFKGGKGVATAGGVLFSIHPFLGMATLLTWLAVAVFFRISSAAALAAAVFAPLYYSLLFGMNWVSLALVGIGGLLIWRHRNNIRQLLNGTEPRLGAKSPSASSETDRK
jgi:acyl phosphate:glycerol-3-phosphate acyltransferase